MSQSLYSALSNYASIKLEENKIGNTGKNMQECLYPFHE